jgi:hypothetical protein
MASLRDAIDAEPVLVDSPKGSRVIRIRPAFRVDHESYAVIESVAWEDAAEIHTTYTQRDGQVRKVWSATTIGGSKVTADSRRALIAAVLEARMEYEVTIEQTIPPLFSLEEL